MLDSAEEKQLVKLLRKIEPGFYPLDVFWEFQRLTKQTAVEIIPFVRDEDEIKLFMIQREKDDKFWPLQWHTPGCIIRPGDEIQEAIDRVLQEELSSPELEIQPTYLWTKSFASPRGDSLGYFMYILMKEIPQIPNSQVFALDSLPNNMVEIQKGLIRNVINEFEAVVNVN